MQLNSHMTLHLKRKHTKVILLSESRGIKGAWYCCCLMMYYVSPVRGGTKKAPLQLLCGERGRAEGQAKA